MFGVQLTAITWLKEFVELAGAALLPFASGVLAAVLPCLAYADDPRNSILATRSFLSPYIPTISLAAHQILEKRRPRSTSSSASLSRRRRRPRRPPPTAP